MRDESEKGSNPTDADKIDAEPDEPQITVSDIKI